MTDFLIERYNAKVQAAMQLREERVAAATQVWNAACQSIQSEWQAASAEATIEYVTAVSHRSDLHMQLLEKWAPSQLKNEDGEAERKTEEPLPPPDKILNLSSPLDRRPFVHLKSDVQVEHVGSNVQVVYSETTPKDA